MGRWRNDAAAADRDAQEAACRAEAEVGLLARLEEAHAAEVDQVREGWDRALAVQNALKAQLQGALDQQVDILHRRKFEEAAQQRRVIER